MAILLGIIQFGIIFNNYITLTDATRAGARKAAVSRFLNDNGAAAKQAVEDSAQGLDHQRPRPRRSASLRRPTGPRPGNQVTVTASYPYSINILGWTIKAGNLTSTTRERLE